MVVFGQLICQAVGAEEKDVAVGECAAVDLHVHPGARTSHNVGDDMPSGMGTRVFRRDRSVVDEELNEGVIGGQPLELPVTE